MSPCSHCGSTRSVLTQDGACLSAEGCRARRVNVRKREDRKRGVTRQCFATYGQGSIRFCELREGHEGLHVHGSREWGGDYSHPIAQAFREIAMDGK
jgi:hypothetical protein